MKHEGRTIVLTSQWLSTTEMCRCAGSRVDRRAYVIRSVYEASRYVNSSQTTDLVNGLVEASFKDIPEIFEAWVFTLNA